MALAARLAKRPAPAVSGVFAKKAKELEPVTIGEIVGLHGNVVCQGSAMLTDVADLLIEQNHSAAAILGEEGTVLGIVTENDIVQAFAEGTQFNYMVTAAVWLQGGRSRCPAAEVEEISVPASAPLYKAAEKMRSQALANTARRHLIVKDGRGELQGVLSSLDLARASCTAGGPGMEEVQRRIASALVADVMKPRTLLASVPCSASLAHALQTMLQSRQNCVLVTDGCDVLGVVTPRDALRAFADHASLSVPTGHWLRGLRSSLAPRQVQAHAALASAARLMAAHCLHHLVVLSADSQVVGVVSASDVAQVIGSAERVVPGYGPMEA